MDALTEKIFIYKVEKNFDRLCSDIYGIEKVFRGEQSAWPGDWEGRSLLAFGNLFSLTGKKIDCMDKFISQMDTHLNGQGYFGEIANGLVREQQLSGNNWFLRGLIKYYDLFGSEKAKDTATSLVENLFIKNADRILNYPTRSLSGSEGGVSGNENGVSDGWVLSTDIGCAYISLDGLCEYYLHFKGEKLKALISGMIENFVGLDFLVRCVQTHATLSATRGIIKFYKATGEKKYLDYAVKIFKLYVEHGMTLNYENFNWFNRKDTWTEPCAIVDSLIVALELYKLIGKEEYKTLARRIYFNGMSFIQRDNGGAGTSCCVCEKEPFLKVGPVYEADFCCTMRYSEGLLAIKNNAELFGYQAEEVTFDGKRYFAGDMLLGEIDDEEALKYFTPQVCATKDGHKLYSILQGVYLPKNVVEKINIKILF